MQKGAREATNIEHPTSDIQLGTLNFEGTTA